MRDWRLRSKLAAVLIIPTLTALALGALRVVDDAQEAAEFQRTADQVAFAVKVTTVVHELQNERASPSPGWRPRTSCCRPGWTRQIAKVDREVTDLRTAAAGLELRRPGHQGPVHPRHPAPRRAAPAARGLQHRRTACPTSR